MTKHTPLVVVMLVALLALVGVTISAQLTSADVVEDYQAQGEEENKDLAVRIIEDVRQLISIPEDIDPTVATIIDVELLREKNPFYNKAENGDHLIVTPDRAILYSTKTGKIIDIVPVTLEPVAGAEG